MAYDGSIKIDTALDGGGFKAGLEKIGGIAKSAFGGMTKIIGGVSAALFAGAVAGVKYNAQMEQYMTSFTTMLGSASKASSMVSQLKKFAAETPFEFSDLAKGSQTLLSFGTSADKLMPTLKMLGDVSQGNKERFDALTLAFAQVSSAGKLSGQDLLQMVNAGFNPLQVMAQKSGKSMAELRDEMGKGKISADDVAKAFQDATGKGGQFYNAMEAQSKTFNGQLSTLKDNAMQFLGNITQGFTDSLKDTALPMVNGWMTQLSDAFQQGGISGVVSTLGTVLAEACNQIAQQAPGIIDMAVSLIQSFLSGIQQNSGQLATAAVNIATSLISGIISAGPQIISTGGQLLLQFAQGFAAQVPQLTIKAVNAIASLAQGFVNNIPTMVQTAVQIFLGFIHGLTQSLPKLIPIAINGILTLADSLIDNIDTIVDAGIQLILALAEGLINALPTLIEKVPVIINKFFDAIDRNLPKILAAGIKLIIMLAKGIIQSIPVIIQNAGQIALAIFNIISHLDMLNLGKSLIKGLGNGIKSLVGWIKNSASGILKSITTPFGNPGNILTNIGKRLIQGLWNGIRSVKDWILGKVSGFMGDIVGGIKGFFGIHSPSKLMEKEIGKFIPPGISIGMDKAMPGTIQDIKSQMSAMMDKARSAISAEQGKIGAAFAASANYQVALAGGYGTAAAPAVYSGPSAVETHISIDGREFAVATAPAIEKQIGWKGAD